MDAPFYDRLPGIATTLHAVKIPALPDQKLKFSNDEVMPIAAGATACKFRNLAPSGLDVKSLLNLLKCA